MLIDLDMPAFGQPSVAWPKNAFPGRPVFAAVIPPGGTEEDARLFAVCSDWQQLRNGGPFHEGKRPDILPTEGYVLETIDSEAVPRLFERGSHPGDLLVMGGGLDRFGRQETAVLAFFHLDDGFSYEYKLSTPAEMRVGLAKACAAVGEPMWDRAAELFDPLGLMRNGTLKGGNPMTQEEFHRYMVEKSSGSSSSLPPLRDFRSLTTRELCLEILAEAKAIVSANPDMRRDHAVYRLLTEAIPSVVHPLKDGNAGEAFHMLPAVNDLYRDPTLCDGSCPAMDRLAKGIGAAANCFRNIFHPDGMLSLAGMRMQRPDIHEAIISAVEDLPGWARRAFRDPDEVLRRRPRSIDHVPHLLRNEQRPYLPLPARRLTASPGLRRHISEIDDVRLELMLEGTESLFRAFDTIPNSCERAEEARDALAIGWQVLASDALRRDPTRAEALELRDPGLPKAAGHLPWASSITLAAALDYRYPRPGRM